MNPKFYFLLVVITAISLFTNQAIAQDYATQQTNGVTGLCVGCGVLNPQNAVNQNNLNDYSLFNLPVGLLSATVQQTLIFPLAGNAGDSLFIKIGSANTILSVNLFSGINIETYSGGTANSDGQYVGQPILRLLDSGRSALITLKPPQPFDRVRLSLHSSLIGLLNGFRVYYASRSSSSVPAPPDVIPDTLTICAGDTAIFHVNDTTATISWYDAATAGNLLATGNTFTVSPDSSTVYYAEAGRGGTRSARSPATVIVHPEILPLTIVAPAKVQAGSSAQYSIRDPQAGITYRWYRSNGGQLTLVATGTSYQTEPIADTLTEIIVYVEAINLTTGCSRPMARITTPVVGSSPNLALQKPVLASSEELGAGPNAVDGDYNTYWRSAQTSPQFIRVDLGADYNIQRVKITWGAQLAESYVIQVANDPDGPWQTLRSVDGNSDAVNDYSDLSGHGRYLLVFCMNGVTTPPWFTIYELEVYGALYAAGSNINHATAVSAAAFKPGGPQAKWTASLSPNPIINGQLRLRSSEEIRQLTLADLNGRVWWTRKISQSSKISALYNIDVSKLPPGMYLVNALNAEGKTQTLKFIRQ